MGNHCVDDAGVRGKGTDRLSISSAAYWTVAQHSPYKTPSQRASPLAPNIESFYRPTNHVVTNKH